MWAPMAPNMIGFLMLVEWELVKRSYARLEGPFLEDHVKLCLEGHFSRYDKQKNQLIRTF